MMRTQIFRVLDKRREPDPSITLARTDSQEVITLSAASLRAEYSFENKVLLILDDDCPFEEGLHIILLSGTNIIDYVLISAMYLSGVFEEVSIRHGNALQFKFEDDRIWTLTVLDIGKRGWTWLPMYARRQVSWLRPCYLLLSKAEL